MIKWICFFCFWSSFAGWAQTSNKADTSEIQIDTTNHVKRATILSLCAPGAGQIYNHIHQQKGSKKAYWKVPLIYAGLGFTGLKFFQNQVLVSDLKKEYRLRENGQSGDVRFDQFDDAGILTLYEDFSKKRDFALLGFILIYGFQIADAAVEAHFLKFDISDDLSLRIRPSMTLKGDLSLSLNFNFH